MVSTTHPIFRVGPGSTITSTIQVPEASTSDVPACAAAIVLVLDNVECFTTNVSLRSASCSSRKHSHGSTTT
jgi:hypothetical protein